jgi:hypothetical protein
MTRTEIDLTDSNSLDFDFTKSGNIVSVVIRNGKEVCELVMDIKDFEVFMATGRLSINLKASGAA